MKLCSIAGCQRQAHARSWCLPHYKRWIRNGDPEAGRRPPVSDWMELVRRDGPLPRWAPFLGPCWIWLGGTNAGGYGRVNPGGGDCMVHRLSYEQFIGAIPGGLELDHLCRVRLCCNPAHLEPVTHQENDLRGLSISAVNATKTHCIRGHAFDQENTYIYPASSRKAGRRACRACQRVGAR